VVIFGLLVFAAITILGVLATKIARKAVIEKVETHLIDKASDVAEIIDGRISAFLQFLEGIARMPAFRDTEISYTEKTRLLDKEIAFIFAIFTCWSLFIIMRYYGYVLMPEYSNLNKELKSKISRKTLYLSFCTLIAELIILWWCWPILAYVIDIILCYL